jgi:sarcosine oxidase subunit beta
MGHGPKNEKPGHNVNSTWQFLEAMAQKVTYLLPAIKKVRVVRQWAGSYNISPDRQPIICESEQLPGYYMAVGFSGHGFMLGPSIGVYLSELITGETPSYDVTLDLGRFARNEIIAEPSVV